MTGLLVHEWVSPHGGSENVLEVMAEALPDAEIFCLWNDATGRLPDRNVRESWLARTPLRRSKVAALPFMPAVWSSVNVHKYEFILVSSHLFAHHVGGRLRSAGPRRYVYVHTPARYIWSPEMDTRGKHLGVRAVAPFFRWLDSWRAGQGSEFAANSRFVQERIALTWHQDSKVIYPPVDIETIRSTPDWSAVLTDDDAAEFARLPREYILGASRFIPYKKLDKVIAAGEAVGVPVVLAGAGPEESSLRRLANDARVPVFFVQRPSMEMLYALYQRALVFMFPPIEDFGIMPVEAMALGTPAVVYRTGGARESVEHLSGGAVLNGFSEAEIRHAVSRATETDMSAVPGRAEQLFGHSRFKRQLRAWIDAEQPITRGGE